MRQFRKISSPKEAIEFTRALYHSSQLVLEPSELTKARRDTNEQRKSTYGRKSRVKSGIILLMNENNNDGSDANFTRDLAVKVALEKVTLTQALHFLRIIFSAVQDSTVKDWIDMELLGYQDIDSLPNYRTSPGTLMANVEFASIGNVVHATMQIPTKLDCIKDSRLRLTESITSIEDYANCKTRKNLQKPVDLRVANTISDIDANNPFTIINAWQPISMSHLTQVQNAVRTKVIDILLKLNENGVTIEDGLEKSLSKELTKDVISIIHNNINIGDNNTFKNTGVSIS